MFLILSPADVIEMIVIDAEVMGDLVDQRLRDLLAQLGIPELELQMGNPEYVNDVRQLAGVVYASFRKRQSLLKPQETLAFGILLHRGRVSDEYLDVVERGVHPARQVVHDLEYEIFKLACIHNMVQSAINGSIPWRTRRQLILAGTVGHGFPDIVDSPVRSGKSRLYEI